MKREAHLCISLAATMILNGPGTPLSSITYDCFHVFRGPLQSTEIELRKRMVGVLYSAINRSLYITAVSKKGPEHHRQMKAKVASYGLCDP
jgi:hypothetical protein